jgi:hypothetical protein
MTEGRGGNVTGGCSGSASFASTADARAAGTCRGAGWWLLACASSSLSSALLLPSVVTGGRDTGVTGATGTAATATGVTGIGAGGRGVLLLPLLLPGRIPVVSGTGQNGCLLRRKSATCNNKQKQKKTKKVRQGVKHKDNDDTNVADDRAARVLAVDDKGAARGFAGDEVVGGLVLVVDAEHKVVDVPRPDGALAHEKAPVAQIRTQQHYTTQKRVSC